MNSTLRLLIFVAFLATACSKSNAPAENTTSAVQIGKTDSLYSSILKEERKIWVYVPHGGGSGFSEQHYPVLYLLDGDSHFLAVSALLEDFSGNGFTPEMIVVAIPNTDRSRDLTPTHSLAMPDGKTQDFLKTTGGGEAFTEFIEKELIPYVESHYPTAPNRMLVGHSFGGLFAINTLINHPQLFNSYVAIDPSMWWDNRRLLNKSDTVLKKNRFDNKTLFVSIANTMSNGMDTTRVAKDTTSDHAHIRSILDFSRLARANSANGLRFASRYYNNDDHGSVPLISEYDGLRFIFDYYRPAKQINSMSLDQLKSHFEKVSQKIGYSMLPPESVVNRAGYIAMQQKKMDDAFAFFNLNIQNYPKSSNVFDSMGDFYLEKKDTAKAIELFEKSISVTPTAPTKKKLDDLKNKK